MRVVMAVQNELGSVIYIANGFTPVALNATDTVFRVSDSVRTYRRLVPVGGNTLVVGGHVQILGAKK